jgi:hypothetical protein
LNASAVLLQASLTGAMPAQGRVMTSFMFWLLVVSLRALNA